VFISMIYETYHNCALGTIIFSQDSVVDIIESILVI
jgi:hypothetical protein